MQSKLLTAAILTLSLGVAPVASAQSQDFEASQAIIVDNIAALSGTIQDNIASLNSSLETGEDVLANAPAILDRLLASVDETTTLLAEDGETWLRLGAMIEQFERERANATRRANESGNDMWQTIAAQWNERIMLTNSLREDISRERARARSLLAELDERREIVTELMKLEAADLIIQNMVAIRDNLVTVNDDMQLMLDKAEQLDGVQN